MAVMELTTMRVSREAFWSYSTELSGLPRPRPVWLIST
jgi:hypothetical protein